MKFFYIFFICITTINYISISSLYIDGNFYGSDGEMIVRLSDGTFWVQTNFSQHNCNLHNPKVELIQKHQRIYLKIRQCGNIEIPVEQVTNAFMSKIDGEFTGVGGETILKLKNGTIWQQSHYKYFYKYAFNPSCIAYYYNGWKINILGKTVKVRKLSGNNSTGNYSNNYQNQTSDNTYFICNNNTENELFFCYAKFDNNNGWVSNGWYKIAPYSKVSIDLGFYQGPFFAYAMSSDRKIFWGDENSPYSFCVDDVEAFNFANSDKADCNHPDLKKIKMAEINITGSVFNWNLK